MAFTDFSAPISSLTAVASSAFVSLLKGGSPTGQGVLRGKTNTRGILISKRHAERGLFDKGYTFQFNPETINDSKSANYSNRVYTGLPYEDNVWGGGGERSVSFELFIDNTPQSNSAAFLPVRTTRRLVEEKNAKGNTSSSQLKFDNSGKFISRVDERGVLPEVELIQSFLYPATEEGEETPKFYSGGMVSPRKFRPPDTAILSIGKLLLEGFVSAAEIKYTLFDYDLTPIRATVNVTFTVNEFSRPNPLKR